MSRSDAIPPATPSPKIASPSSLPYAQDFKNTYVASPADAIELQLPEGVYTVRDDIVLGAVPAHPNFQTPQSNNVLDTSPQPLTAAPMLCTTALLPVRSEFPFEEAFQLSALEKSLPDQSAHSPSKNVASSRFKYLATGNLKAYVAGEGGPVSPTTAKENKEPVKRRKPKTGITKSNSSLISRATPHENLHKRLNDRNPEDLFAFVNNSRSFLWLDMTSSQKADQLTKIMFTKGHPICHDVNLTTRTMTPKGLAHLDVVMGFSTGDIVWYEPMSQKYSRINKRDTICASAVLCVKWIPGSENLFVAGHKNGSVIIYDKERDDGQFLPEAPLRPVEYLLNGYRRPDLGILKSQNSKAQKTNPVAVFRPCRQEINDMSFSPDGRFLATAGEDRTLCIIDLMREKITDVYYSYFEGLTAVAWSPDGKLLVTGGQDDLVSVWSFEDRTILARCYGHKSWISSIAFDPWRCDGGDYRFGSVGLDCRLILWDYSAALVNGVGNASIRPSVASTANLPATSDDAKAAGSTDGERLGSPESSESGEAIVHKFAGRKEVAPLKPVFNEKVSDTPLSWVGFQEHSIITASEGGRIRTYNRPA